MIQAKNEYALKSSLSQLKGSVLTSIKEIRKAVSTVSYRILNRRWMIQNISVWTTSEKLAQTVEEEKKKIRRLADSFDEGKMIREGIRTVIVETERGKIFSVKLSGRRGKGDRHGYRRNDKRYSGGIILNGITLRVIDTAGIRETEDVVEKIGVGKAKQMAENADLILYVVDSSLPLDDNDARSWNYFPDGRVS